MANRLALIDPGEVLTMLADIAAVDDVCARASHGYRLFGKSWASLSDKPADAVLSAVHEARFAVAADRLNEVTGG